MGGQKFTSRGLESSSKSRASCALCCGSSLYHDENVAANENFGLSPTSSVEGIRQLSEATGHKVVFHDLNHVLGDYPYMVEIFSSRIEPFLDELEQNLEVVSLTVHDRVGTRVITDLMKASFEGLLLVLLGGGPSRAVTPQEALTIVADFKFPGCSKIPGCSNRN